MLAHGVAVLVLDDHRARACRRRRRRTRRSPPAARAGARARQPRTPCTRGRCRRTRRRARAPAGAGGAWRASRARCGPRPSVLGAWRLPSRRRRIAFRAPWRRTNLESRPAACAGPRRSGTVIGGAGARYAGTRAANVARSKERGEEALEQTHLEAAERMVKTLGTMKGAAMKIGQLASFIDTEFLPPEYARALPGGALEAALPGAADAVEEGQERARGGVGGPGRGALRGLRARRRRRRVDRPGPPRGAARRPQGRREDPVPGRRRRGPRRHAERRDDPAAREGARARARRQGRRRRAEGARARGARLRVRGAEPALVRARVPRPPVHLRARTSSRGCRATACS